MAPKTAHTNNATHRIRTGITRSNSPLSLLLLPTFLFLCFVHFPKHLCVRLHAGSVRGFPPVLRLPAFPPFLPQRTVLASGAAGALDTHTDGWHFWDFNRYVVQVRETVRIFVADRTAAQGSRFGTQIIILGVHGRLPLSALRALPQLCFEFRHREIQGWDPLPIPVPPPRFRESPQAFR